MSQHLPQPTTDMTQNKANLDEFGYCLLANALTNEEVTALRTRLAEQAAAEIALKQLES